MISSNCPTGPSEILSNGSGGDFDLLIGAYKNNLKVTEVPVTYFERKENETKINSLFFNTIRMLFIVLASYYKLRLKK